MTPSGSGWNEANLSEHPAVGLLRKLGYVYIPPETLEAERESFKEVVLTKRLAAAIKKLNPWLSDDNVKKVVREVANVQAASLVEANEKLHTLLTYGVTAQQDLSDGMRGHTVHLVDFDTPRNNELVVTRQFKVKGAKKHVIPDVVIFANGIPLTIVECKSPTLGEKWKAEAVEQLHRYQETTDNYRDLGAPKLFAPMQLLVATCGQAAIYGTVGTPKRFFGEWKVPFPMSVEELEKELERKPTPQDILFHGLLAPENLLDVVRNFTVFEADSTTGRKVRKLCRYQQFAAANRAIARAKKSKSPTERGGVVWHTQGSGKSLTMLWLALKLRRDPAFANPTIAIVTDRIDLDDQIAKTFVACGFPNPDRADGVKGLRELLSGPTGKTVLTTVQKFQELTSKSGGSRSKSQEHPTLSTASNIFVLADEAHRTQYGGLAANLRKALPNACFFGFTGTPIDKDDRSTLQTFGPYIDQYTIEQAVADGATVPIFYESRLPELRIAGKTLDAVFDRVFADRSKEEREAIKAKYATEQTLAIAPKRVEVICLDLIDHFTNYIRPNGFKAQVVTVSREAAVLYKETLDRLNAPQSAVIMSGTNDDDAALVKHHTSADERKALIKKFLDPTDPLAILIVCDMLITGFDAPVEQVMYLDSPLKEHTLLQAIARVNRRADKKDYGLITDYWGVSDDLQEALAIFSPTDVKGAMEPKVDELPRLQTRHAAAMRFFARLKDRDNLDACIAVLEPEDVRAEFNVAFRRFAQSLDMLLPDPRALPYADDMRWLGKIRAAASARFRDDKIDISDCGAKVRALIEESVAADGIQVLVKKVSLFSKEFDDKLDKLKTTEAKASEMEHAIRHEIHVRLEENPAFFSSLRERLEKLVEDLKARRIDAAKQLELFQVLFDELKHESKAAERVGLSPTGFAIYGLLRETALKTGETEETYSEANKALASLVEEAIEPHTSIVDWSSKEEVQRKMRKDIKRQLTAAKVPPSEHDALAQSIVELAKVRKGQ
jgi:type I restriction enzyme R subunit